MISDPYRVLKKYIDTWGAIGGAPRGAMCHRLNCMCFMHFVFLRDKKTFDVLHICLNLSFEKFLCFYVIKLCYVVIFFV